MYTHARQFPHLAGRSDDEIRAVARRAYAREPRWARLMRMRNVVLLVAMFSAILGMSRTGFDPGLSMMLGGGVATMLILLWNVIWVNKVLFLLTNDQVAIDHRAPETP